MISDLPRDLAEEVLSRLPVTALRGVRSICKKLNILCKNRSFTMKHIGKAKAAAKNYHRKEFQVVMMIQYRVCLFSVNLLNPSIDRIGNPSIDRIGKLISIDDADRVDICKIFHCDGLFLCITKDRSTFVVWNPCSGQTRWIRPRNSYHKLFERYALGYENKNKYKVLRILDDYDHSVKRLLRQFEIYDLNSDSWKVVMSIRTGIYSIINVVCHSWATRTGLLRRRFHLQYQEIWETYQISLISYYVLILQRRDLDHACLCLFTLFYNDTVTLSSVRETHLSVLFQQLGLPLYTVKIWISSKIEPNAVSWNKLFLSVDMKPSLMKQNVGTLLMFQEAATLLASSMSTFKKTTLGCCVARFEYRGDI